MENKYFHISYKKELVDSEKLIEKIKKENWIDADTVLVSCSPDYSSRLVQLINHKLSYIADNELFEQIDLNMPYPTNSQVWDSINRGYQQYTTYLLEWIRRHIQTNQKYLFIDSGVLRGENFTKLKQAISGRLDRTQYMFGSLYIQEDSIFKPDFYVEVFNKEKQGGLLFEWENVNNPNWDY